MIVECKSCGRAFGVIIKEKENGVILKHPSFMELKCPFCGNIIVWQEKRLTEKENEYFDRQFEGFLKSICECFGLSRELERLEENHIELVFVAEFAILILLAFVILYLVALFTRTL